MFSIESKPYGFKIIFPLNVDFDNSMELFELTKESFFSKKGSFSVLVDIRNLSSVKGRSSQVIEMIQRLAKEYGMKRSAIVYNKNIITNQFKIIATESHILNLERYIDASMFQNWEEKALNWLLKGIEP